MSASIVPRTNPPAHENRPRPASNTGALRRTPAGIDRQVAGATSFVRAPGQGLWDKGGNVERDNIAVIEVMTDDIDPPFWQAFRRKLEHELAQQEIVIRAQQVNRL